VLDKSLELLRREQLSIMQQLGASAFYTVVRWHKQGEVDIFLSSWLSVCQKLSNLAEIWRSSDKNKLDHFWHTLQT